MANLVGLVALSLAPAAALTATENGTGVDVTTFTGGVKFILNSSATGGAGQTADFKIQHSDQAATGFTDTGIAFTQVTNAAASHQERNWNVDGLKKFVRVVSTLGGTSPTVTRSVSMIGQKAQP